MGRFDNLPSWSRAGMKRCPCGAETALFYDEEEIYRVECAECDFVVYFKADSRVRAKDKWLNYHTRWTPIKKAWPIKTGRYLVTYREWSNGDYLPKYDRTFVKILKYSKAIFQFPRCIDKKAEEDTNREVLAWQELPEIYQED